MECSCCENDGAGAAGDLPEVKRLIIVVVLAPVERLLLCAERLLFKHLLFIDPIHPAIPAATATHEMPSIVKPTAGAATPPKPKALPIAAPKPNRIGKAPPAVTATNATTATIATPIPNPTKIFLVKDSAGTPDVIASS